MKVTNQNRKQGFTLIELLVVITIIAILASVSVPVFGLIQDRAKRTKTLAHGKQIYFALANWSIDEDGIYPITENSSNEAFRELFTRKFQDERIFYVAGSAWTPTKPDNEVGQPPEYEQGLERGENHWAYVSQLNSSSKGNLPLIADGFSESVGQYAELGTKKGGIWEGEYAIIVRVDGSAQMEKPDGDFRVYEKKSGQSIDIFSEDYGIPSSAVYNPL